MLKKTYHGQDRSASFLSQGELSTSGLCHLQTSRSVHQPSPTRAESGVAGILKLSAECGVRSKGSIDHVQNTTSGLATTTSLHAVPIEGVVPDLGSVVEETSIATGLRSYLKKDNAIINTIIYMIQNM